MTFELRDGRSPFWGAIPIWLFRVEVMRFSSKARSAVAPRAKTVWPLRAYSYMQPARWQSWLQSILRPKPGRALGLYCILTLCCQKSSVLEKIPLKQLPYTGRTVRSTSLESHAGHEIPAKYRDIENEVT